VIRFITRKKEKRKQITIENIYDYKLGESNGRN